jgi:hypothetical protein
MTDFAEQLDRMVMYAPPDDLVRALAKKGATTRRLKGGELKVTLRIEIEKRQPVQRRRRRVSGGPAKSLVYGRIPRPSTATPRSGHDS